LLVTLLRWLYKSRARDVKRYDYTDVGGRAASGTAAESNAGEIAGNSSIFIMIQKQFSKIAISKYP